MQKEECRMKKWGDQARSAESKAKHQVSIRLRATLRRDKQSGMGCAADRGGWRFGQKSKKEFFFNSN